MGLHWHRSLCQDYFSLHLSGIVYDKNMALLFIAILAHAFPCWKVIQDNSYKKSQSLALSHSYVKLKMGNFMKHKS